MTTFYRQGRKVNLVEHDDEDCGFLKGAIVDALVQAGLCTRCCCKVVHHCDAQPCTAGSLANSNCPGDLSNVMYRCQEEEPCSHCASCFAATWNRSIMDNTAGTLTKQPRFLPEILEATE